MILMEQVLEAPGPVDIVVGALERETAGKLHNHKNEKLRSQRE